MNRSLEEAASNTLKQLELKLQERKNAPVNGMPALVALSKQEIRDQSTGQTQTNLVMSYFIKYDDTYYVFHGVSTTADFSAYTAAFNATMNGFAMLTDPSKLNVKPKKIIIKKIQRTGSFANALKSMGIPENQINELALLNNIDLNDQVQVGRLIKTIGQQLDILI